MIRRFAPCLIASTSLSVLATALPICSARAESLADAVAYAYQTNPGLQAQRASLRALDETYVQARAGFGPNITGSVGETSYHDRLSRNSHYANTESETLSLVQPLFTGGRLRSRLTESEAGILAGRESLRRFEIDLLQRVVAAYVGVRRDEALWEISRDTVTVLEKQVADSEARFAVREITMTDVAESKARLADAQSALANAQGSLAVARAQFAETVGEPAADLAPPPVLDAVPASVDQAFDAAEANNPQLQGAKYIEQRSRAKIAEAKAAVLPSISAQLSYQHTPFLPYQTQPYNYVTSAMVTLSQSIFSSGQISSQIRQTIEENNSDRLAIDDTRQKVILEVSTAWEQLSSARLQISGYDAAVKADEFSFYGNREESKMALRSTIEVLNAELELSTAQQNLVRARSTAYVSQVQLLGSMGILSPALLTSTVTPYDPAANFRRVRHKGETPLEWPVRVLDSLAAPPIGPNPPASIAEARVQGSPMPAQPVGEGPIRSILSTLDSPPPEPK